MKDDSRFNKWFSAFILIGMTAALIITTIIKLSQPEANPTKLLIAAFGSLMGVCATVAASNGRIITFLFGFLDVTIYGSMCLMNWYNGSSGLGSALLHFVYLTPLQFVGFYQWRKRGAKGGNKPKARRLTAKQGIGYTALFLAGSIIAYLVIARFDKSQADTFIKVAVVFDVLPMMCNIFGQLLMSTAYMEQWLFWIGVNISSITMWSLTLANDPESDYALVYIIKYVFYLINAVNGLRIWINLSASSNQETQR